MTNGLFFLVSSNIQRYYMFAEWIYGLSNLNEPSEPCDDVYAQVEKSV